MKPDARTVKWDPIAFCWRVPAHCKMSSFSVEAYYANDEWKTKFLELDRMLSEADGFAKLWINLGSGESQVFESGNVDDALFGMLVDFCCRYGHAPKTVQLFPVLEANAPPCLAVASVEAAHIQLYYWILVAET